MAGVVAATPPRLPDIEPNPEMHNATLLPNPQRLPARPRAEPGAPELKTLPRRAFPTSRRSTTPCLPDPSAGKASKVPDSVPQSEVDDTKFAAPKLPDLEVPSGEVNDAKSSDDSSLRSSPESAVSVEEASASLSSSSETAGDVEAGEPDPDFTLSAGTGEGKDFHLPGSVYNELYYYQREAMNWLWSVCCMGSGGILADDMGLGKTMMIYKYQQESNS